jgi:hypothetical protein
VRIPLPQEERLLQWLQSLQARQVELRQHEHVDTAKLQDWSKIPQGTPLFESVLVVENFPLDGAREPQGPAAPEVAHGQADGTARLLEHMRTASSLDVRDFHATVMRLTFPMMLTVLPQSELFLHAAYQSARFEPAAVKGILEYLRAVLEKLPTWSTQPLSELSRLLPEPAIPPVALERLA